MIDYSLKLYSRGLETVNSKKSSSNPLNVVTDAVHGLMETTETTDLALGWALPKKASRKPFSDDVKKFLVECFEEGLKKKRLNPATIEKRMAEAETPDGNKRFTVEQRMDVRQIAGFLSRESKKRRIDHARMKRDQNGLTPKRDHDTQADLEEETHEDAPWIEYMKDEQTWTEWDEFLTAIYENLDPLFIY